MANEVEDVTPEGSPSWLTVWRGPNAGRVSRERARLHVYGEMQWAGFYAIAFGVLILAVGSIVWPGLSIMALSHILLPFLGISGGFIVLGYLVRLFGKSLESGFDR